MCARLCGPHPQSPVSGPVMEMGNSEGGPLRCSSRLAQRQSEEQEEIAPEQDADSGDDEEAVTTADESSSDDQQGSDPQGDESDEQGSGSSGDDVPQSIAHRVALLQRILNGRDVAPQRTLAARFRKLPVPAVPLEAGSSLVYELEAATDAQVG